MEAVRRASAFLEIRVLSAAESESETPPPALELSQAAQKAAAAPGPHAGLPDRVLGSASGCLGHLSNAGGMRAKLLPPNGAKGSRGWEELGAPAQKPPERLLLPWITESD